MVIRWRNCAGSLISRCFARRLYLHLKHRDGVEPSVGSVGDNYDNAFAEMINGLCMAEVSRRRGPKRSFEAVEYATLEWIDWFNRRRLLEPIGNIPPVEAEERYYAMNGTELVPESWTGC